MNDILRMHKLIVESEKLTVKIINLEDFMKSDKFNNISDVQKNLLTDQYDIMRDYLTVLLRRIYFMNEVSDNEV